MVWLSAGDAHARCGGLPAGFVPAGMLHAVDLPHGTSFPSGNHGPWQPRCSGPSCSEAPAPTPTTPIPTPESASVRHLFVEPASASLRLSRGLEASFESRLLTGFDLVSDIFRPPRG